MGKILIDKETGCKFDDFVEYSENEIENCEYDTNAWTQVCHECAKKYHLLDSYLDIGSGSGICGVVGCKNESEHYYDFNAN